MGWLKKRMWKRRKLCYFLEGNEIIQEWVAADIGNDYIVCETMGLQVCYQIPKPLIRMFMKEKGLGNAELSCA